MSSWVSVNGVEPEIALATQTGFEGSGLGILIIVLALCLVIVSIWVGRAVDRRRVMRIATFVSGVIPAVSAIAVIFSPSVHYRGPTTGVQLGVGLGVYLVLLGGVLALLAGVCLGQNRSVQGEGGRVLTEPDGLLPN
jgi:hypothetical protein